MDNNWTMKGRQSKLTNAIDNDLQKRKDYGSRNQFDTSSINFLCLILTELITEGEVKSLLLFHNRGHIDSVECHTVFGFRYATMNWIPQISPNRHADEISPMSKSILGQNCGIRENNVAKRKPRTWKSHQHRYLIPLHIPVQMWIRADRSHWNPPPRLQWLASTPRSQTNTNHWLVRGGRKR